MAFDHVFVGAGGTAASAEAELRSAAPAKAGAYHTNTRRKEEKFHEWCSDARGDVDGPEPLEFLRDRVRSAREHFFSSRYTIKLSCCGNITRPARIGREDVVRGRGAGYIHGVHRVFQFSVGNCSQ